MTARSKTAIDTLAWMSHEAFEGDPDQSLIASLRDVSDGDFIALLPGAGRSIADILEHVGWAKWMYEDYAFGPGSLRGDQPPLIPANQARARPRAELMGWLREGHHRWLTSVRALPDDTELESDRRTNWGESLPTRVLILILIGHDFYHAGEINHIRVLLQGTDTWPYE